MTDLGPAERFVAGAIGRPGERVFIVHVVAAGRQLWFVAEKGQVATLAARSLELLAEANIIPDPEATAALVAAAELTEPDEVQFRIGTISLQVGNAELVTVQFDSVDEDDAVVFVVAPEQLQAMAVKALEVVGKGRPICPDCRLPKDPDGHRCPSGNGHHPA